MAGRQLHTLLRQLYRATPPETGRLSDAELLERFAKQRDEAAFEVLVWRHAALVFGVCRRLLACVQDVEDAFQATFLVLVRKAGSVRRGEALSGWLHQVAQRVALRARARAAKRATVEYPAEEWPAPESDKTYLWTDLRPVLDEEVSRLPARYRWPVILCYLEGKSTEEAARQLGCPRGTVLSRLAWARQRLRERLTRRGVTLSAAALTAGLAQQTEAAPATLVGKGVRVALWIAAGNATAAGEVSGSAVTLMEGVLQTMYLMKVRTAAVIVLVLALLAGGAGLWTFRSATAETPERPKTETNRLLGHGESARNAAKDYTPPRPLGEWERNVAGYHITLRVEPDRVYATFSGEGENFKARGDYSMTKDGVLFGVVTDLEMQGEEEVEASVYLDQPFSFRCRVDGNILIVKDPKFIGLDLDNKQQELLLIVQGRYRKKTATKDGDGW